MRREELIFQLKQEAELEELEQREELLQQLRRREEERRKKKKQKQKKLQQLRTGDGGNSQILGKISLLEGHKQLVDQSNERILARIEEMKLSRQREAIMEQERLLAEQQAAIGLLQRRKKQRKKQNLRLRTSVRTASASKPTVSSTSLAARLKKKQKSSALSAK